MPRGDGTGPMGQGPGTGRGRGFGRGQGQGQGRSTMIPQASDGNCLCPKCNTVVAHTPGQPCNSMSCPNCGTKMIRG